MQDSNWVPPILPGTVVENVLVVIAGCVRAAIRTAVTAPNGSYTIAYVDAASGDPLTPPFEREWQYAQGMPPIMAYITNWCEMQAAGAGGSVATLTPTLVRSITTGTISAGARSVAFAITGSANVTINGFVAAPSDPAVSFDTGGHGVLPAMTYDATGSELLVAVLR